MERKSLLRKVWRSFSWQLESNGGEKVKRLLEKNFNFF